MFGPLSLAVDPAKPETVLLSSVVGILRSVDSGLTWTMLNEGGLEATIPANPPVSAPEGFRLTTALVADPDQADLFWVGTGLGKTKGIGVFRTRDGGENWAALRPGHRRPPDPGAGDLRRAGNSRVLYAATMDGVWVLTSP